jgi:hypothetical protein
MDSPPTSAADRLREAASFNPEIEPFWLFDALRRMNRGIQDASCELCRHPISEEIGLHL